MKTKFEPRELVLIKNSHGEYFTTAANVPTVYVVYQVSCFKDKPTEYVMETINCPTTIRTSAFTEDRLMPVPSNHPIFEILLIENSDKEASDV